MVSYLASLWKETSGWGRASVIFAVVFVFYVVGRGLLEALYHRDGWKRWIRFGGWLVGLILINSIWGIPGLLITIACGGGIVAWEFLSQADRAEKRRSNRLLRAMRAYLRAQYQWYCEHRKFDGGKGRMDYEEWIKECHQVSFDHELLSRYDEEGTTAEEFDSMRVATQAAAAAAAEERKKKSARQDAEEDG